MLDGLVDEFAQEHLDGAQIRAGFAYAKCPFHQTKDGTPFWISKETGSWACWTCHEKGRDLLELMTRLGVGTRKAKALLADAREEAKKLEPVKRIKQKRKARQELIGQSVIPEHKALLAVFDYTAVDLLDEGFSEEVLIEHRIGYDRKHEKITFPIFDIDGNLIGISGRKDDFAHGPKYKFYEGWHINADGVRVPGELGEWFPKYSSNDIRNHLWRGDHVYHPIYRGESEQLVIVEGYKAALWLVQHGWTNTVALMGSSMTEQQERLVKRMGTPTWVFLDANKAGRMGSKDICWRLGNASFPVYECNYDVIDIEDDDPQEGVSAKREKLQPSDLSEVDIELVLSSAIRKTRRMKTSWHKQQQ